MFFLPLNTQQHKAYRPLYDLRTLTIPAAWNIRCDYQLARLSADPAALALYRFILGDVGQGYLRQAGFMPFSDAA